MKYEFGDFLVDAARRLLLDADGRVVPVTPKAFDTLLYLIEHRSEVQKKDELIKAVWPERVVEENNLNQNISALRKALGERRGQHRFIVTIPGRGYRFVAAVSTRDERSLHPEPAIGSIAVLPFLPLVAEHRDPALELGMADTLIARLSGIRQIVVRPIGSVRKYLDMEQDPVLAGRELGVDSVLEGSIQRWGEAIRVTVRLMTVVDGAAIWAATFDERFSDIFSVQDAIAERVALALAPQLGQEEKLRLVRRPTENTAVYELYLKGRFHLFRLTPPEMQTAIDYFQRAITMDASFAPAYIGLAMAHFRLPLAGELRATDHYPKAKEAAQRALKIDDQNAEARAILGWIAFWFDWNWSAAESHFRQAQQLDPTNVESHLGYAHLLSNTGRHREALAEARRARELDPLLLLANALECQFLLHAGQVQQALAKLDQALALDANFWLTHLYYSGVYFAKGQYAEAAEEAEFAAALSGGSPTARTSMACALVKSGKQKEARAILQDLQDLATRRYIPPYLLALLHHALGEREQSLAFLEQGIEHRDPRMTFLLVEPKWKELRDTPEFTAVLRRVGL